MQFAKTEICLEGNRTLINRCQKAGLRLYNPRGPFNGYGYTRLPLVVEIKTRKDLETFEKIKAEVDAIPKKPQKTQEEIIAAWARRLCRLLDGELTIEECSKLAEEKLRAKEQRIDELNERQDEHFSVKRQKLIDRIERENPLRRVVDEDHARSIIAAHYRHTQTNYDDLLHKYSSDSQWGLIPPGSAREMARRDMQPRYPNDDTSDSQEVSNGA